MTLSVPNVLLGRMPPIIFCSLGATPDSAETPFATTPFCCLFNFGDVKLTSRRQKLIWERQKPTKKKHINKMLLECPGDLEEDSVCVFSFGISPTIYRAQNPETPKSLRKVSREELGPPDPTPQKVPKKARKVQKIVEVQKRVDFNNFGLFRLFSKPFRGPGSGGPKLLRETQSYRDPPSRTYPTGPDPLWTPLNPSARTWNGPDVDPISTWFGPEGSFQVQIRSKSGPGEGVRRVSVPEG